MITWEPNVTDGSGDLTQDGIARLLPSSTTDETLLTRFLRHDLRYFLF